MRMRNPVGGVVRRTAHGIMASMEQLWAPWRMAYIARESSSEEEGCFLCAKLAGHDDAANLILARGKRCFVIMNLFPYNSGHLMIAPTEHVPTIGHLDAPTLTELMTLAQRCLGALGASLRPDGYNMGINQGKVAGRAWRSMSTSTCAEVERRHEFHAGAGRREGHARTAGKHVPEDPCGAGSADDHARGPATADQTRYVGHGAVVVCAGLGVCRARYGKRWVPEEAGRTVASGQRPGNAKRVGAWRWRGVAAGPKRQRETEQAVGGADAKGEQRKREQERRVAGLCDIIEYAARVLAEAGAHCHRLARRSRSTRPACPPGRGRRSRC